MIETDGSLYLLIDLIQGELSIIPCHTDPTPRKSINFGGGFEEADGGCSSSTVVARVRFKFTDGV